MRKLIWLIAAFAIGFSWHHWPAAAPRVAKAKSMVYVAIGDDGAHGSGVHIGRGYILTAAHVAGDINATLTVVDNLGAKHAVEVMWINHKYDVALLRVSDFDTIAVSQLLCRAPHRGEAITMSGNPGPLRDITTHGYIAGDTIEFGPWANTDPIEGALVAGMSGGPVFDDAGRVVGINVGVMTSGNSMVPIPTPIDFIVPAKPICDLLDRL